MADIPSANELSKALVDLGARILQCWPNPLRLKEDRPGLRFMQLLTIRSTSTFQSVVLLLDNGRHDEAAVLFRRLLEDSLRANYVAKYPKRADGLALKHEMTALNKTIYQLQKLVTKGYNQLEPMLTQRRTARAELDRLASRLIVKLRDFPQPEQIADQLGRAGDPLQYGAASHPAHSVMSPMIHGYIDDADPSSVQVSMKSENIQDRAAIGRAAGQAYAMLVASSARFFEMPNVEAKVTEIYREWSERIRREYELATLL